VIAAGTDGYPELAAPLSLIDCDLPEEEVRTRFPRFWEYLMSGRDQGLHEGYLASRRSPWYSQEKRPPAPFLSTYMGRGREGRKPFRFFWNKSQATAPNVYLLFYPRPMLAAALQTRSELHAVILAWLCDIETDRLVAGGRVYGGGLHKLEPNELAALPAQTLAETVGLSLASQLKFAW
jgi:adenine-specific DNA-methyltransferase